MSHTATIYYHADCLDGFGAAYAAWLNFGEAACYRPMHYDQPWNPGDVAGRDVFILDFSFPVAELEAMARIARSVALLDHHASARLPWEDRLQDGADGLSTYHAPELPLRVAFDLAKSGARLAWEHFHPELALPLAISHIEDQDLWRYGIPGTRPFCRALRLLPFDFAAWDGVVRSTGTPASDRYRSMVAEGEAIDRFCALEVERLAASHLVMPVTLESDRNPVTGLAINASALFSSDLGHRLAMRSGTFGLLWQLAGDGTIKASLRADGKVNVARLAERYGGGGHPNAAGFRMPAARFFAEILKP